MFCKWHWSVSKVCASHFRHNVVGLYRVCLYKAPGCCTSLAVTLSSRLYSMFQHVHMLALPVQRGSSASSSPLHCLCCSSWLVAEGQQSQTVYWRNTTKILTDSLVSPFSSRPTATVFSLAPLLLVYSSCGQLIGGSSLFCTVSLTRNKPKQTPTAGNACKGLDSCRNQMFTKAQMIYKNPIKRWHIYNSFIFKVWHIQ